MSRKDYLYSDIAYVMNELISKVEKEKGVIVPFERFRQSVDWRLDCGADKYNQMIQFFKDQGYTFDEEIPLLGDSDDWEQALVGHYLFRDVMPKIEGSATTPTLTPFEVDKIVMLGASITNHACAASTLPIVEGYLESKYGKKVSIVNEAVSGWRVQDLVDNIDTILDKYVSDKNVVAYLHIGGGDIGSSAFLDNSESVNQALFDGLNKIYDAAESKGIKLIQAALTFRDYGGITLRNDPEEQKEVPKGSYTYTRDWIVEVMKERSPELVKNGWPVVNQYDVTRNMYQEWVDYNDPSDYVHPSHIGRLVYLTYAVESIMTLSKGNLPVKVEPRDFNVPIANASQSLDTVYGFAYDSYIQDGVKTDNINWIARGRPPVTGTELVYVDDTVLTDGTTKPELKLYSYVNYALRRGKGNTSDPTNSTATLLNNTLLLSALTFRQGNGYLGVIVEGLEPNVNYEIEFNAGATGSEYTTEYCTLNGSNNPLIIDAASEPHEDNLVRTTVRTDHTGKLFIAASEANPTSYGVMGGFRIKSLI